MVFDPSEVALEFHCEKMLFEIIKNVVTSYIVKLEIIPAAHRV